MFTGKSGTFVSAPTVSRQISGPPAKLSISLTGGLIVARPGSKPSDVAKQWTAGGLKGLGAGDGPFAEAYGNLSGGFAGGGLGTGVNGTTGGAGWGWQLGGGKPNPSAHPTPATLPSHSNTGH
jgi:hypothetical protein